MSFIIGAVLVVVGLLSAAVLAVGIPFFFTAIAYDVASSHKAEVAEVATDAEHSSTRIAVERGVARAFVIAGGVFWAIAVFAGLYSYGETGLGYALLAAFMPLAAILATLIVGWYYERVASVLLAIASVAVVAWGVVYQFEMGVWAIMTFALIGPMLTASVLFWLARRDQEAFERATAARPELALVFAARSSIN